MVFMPPNLAHTLGHPQSMHLLSIQGLTSAPRKTTGVLGRDILPG
jgi:hypothetical protein